MKKQLKKATKRRLKLLHKNPDEFWKDVDFIGEDVFYENEFLEEISIPNTISYISAYAFYKCVKLKKVVLPKSINFISSYSFYDTQLQQITIPSNVQIIFSYAFSYCDLLQSIKLNEGLKEIRENAFSYCDIKEVVFPKSLDKISYNAFYDNPNLQCITFPEKIIEIESKSAFQKCNIRTIKVGKKVLHLGANDEFLYIVNLPTENAYGIVIQNIKTKIYSLIKINNNCVDCIHNIPKSVVESNNNLEDILYWQKTKKASTSKTVQKAPFPEKYILDAIGQNTELIYAYYQTKSNGVSILENNLWFKSLTDGSKTALIRLYAHLGGFEDNACHQQKVAKFILNDLSKYLRISDYTASYFFKDLPNNLDNIREVVVEYQHDKNNKIIMENGLPKIKCEKTVQYHKQIFKFFEEYCTNINFFNYAQSFVLNYTKINSLYKKTLKELNPNRNPKGDLQKYNQLKEKGLAGFFFQDFLINENFYFVNEELKTYVSTLPPSQSNQQKIEGFDKYLTEAKILTQNAIQQNRRIKVFAENVKDNTNDELRYFWPPITSVVALTIGDRFRTCYSIDGANEVAIDCVINNPNDNIVLIYKNNLPVAYCRVSYDEKNKGILIDNIELDKNIIFDENDKKEIWFACVKAVKDMKVAMNEEGIYPVERINCKPDPYNKVFATISHLYFSVNSIKNGVELCERHYETKKDILHQTYYSNYDKRFLSQIIIESPELDKQKER